jgi:hypothetical protein
VEKLSSVKIRGRYKELERRNFRGSYKEINIHQSHLVPLENNNWNVIPMLVMNAMAD